MHVQIMWETFSGLFPLVNTNLQKRNIIDVMGKFVKSGKLQLTSNSTSQLWDKCRGFTIVFSRKTASFLWQTKMFELNFLQKNSPVCLSVCLSISSFISYTNLEISSRLKLQILIFSFRVILSSVLSIGRIFILEKWSLHLNQIL